MHVGCVETQTLHEACTCIGESVDSLCRDETDAPMYGVIHFKSVQTFKRLNCKPFWIAYCVSGVAFYP